MRPSTPPTERAHPSLLQRTFVHVPGIGYVTEKRLWQRGITRWEDALEREEPPGSFTESRWQLVRDQARSSLQSLTRGDHRPFAQALENRDQWRAVEDFRDRTAYVDIETDGSYHQGVTVVGLYDGTRVKQYVRGENLGEFAQEVARYALLVTFNGATFDLPILRRTFPQVDWDHLHVDLRFVLSKLGYKGGLKSIERELGIERESEVRGLSGEDAIWLWRDYRRGSAEALEILLQYNAADIENLQILLDLALPRMTEKLESDS